MLFAKWKRLNDITKYVKINKYSFKELAAILKLKQKVTDTEFVRFVNSEGLPYIAQLLGACNSSDVPKNLVDKITKIIERKN